MDAPEKIGLIPGLLQHDSPEVNERHNNLARSVQAGQRFAAHGGSFDDLVGKIEFGRLLDRPGSPRA
jgi:hypothetical protein